MEKLYTSADAEKVVTRNSTNVSFGSLADMGLPNRHVRFAPESRHPQLQH
jgi:hypothetical protein